MRAIQHQRDNRDLSATKRFDGQQRVIDPTKPRPPDDDRGKLQPSDYIHDIFLGRDRYMNSADSFDHHVVISV